MTRSLTFTELAYTRSKNQASALKLAFPVSHIIFAAQVNGSVNTDSVVAIPYHSVTAGAYADVIPNMAVWIGSVAGAYDLGIGRIRKAADATNIYPGENSDLRLSNGAYITVVDDFLPFQKNLRSTSDITCDMDYDIPYTDQYENPYPFPNMGPDAVIYTPNSVISSGNPATTTFDGSGAFAVTGSVSSRTWAALGSGISITNGSTATPTFHVTTTGTWKVSCTVVANGKTSVGWRTIVAFDKTHPPVNAFNLTRPPSGDKNSGGWSFEIKLYDQAAIASVKDRQQVILFARDWYTNASGVITEISLGPITNRENILCEGWIDKQTLHYDPDGAYVIFTVRGPAYWLDQSSEFILGIEDWNGTIDASHVADWTNYQELTVDKGLYALLYWRSTIPFISDVYLTGDTKALPSIEASQGSLWSQIKTFTYAAILANPLCNRYGQLYIEVDTQLVPSSGRSGFPVVMTIEKYDLKKGTLDISRNTQPRTSQVAASGISYTWGDPTGGAALFSLAPGHAFKQFGQASTLEKLLLSSQSQLNVLNSLFIARDNNPYPNIPVDLAGNNRFVDICPHQYVYMERAADDNPRGIEFANNIVSNTVSFQWDAKNGFLSCTVEGEAETFEDLAVNGDIPVAQPIPGDPGTVPVTPIAPITPPTFAPITFPSITFPTFPSLPSFPVPSAPASSPVSFPWIIGTPAAGDIPGILMTKPRLAIAVFAYAWGGTVTFNIQKRTAPGTPGTNLFTSDITATSTPLILGVNDPVLPISDCVGPVIISTTETPTYVLIQLLVQP